MYEPAQASLIRHQMEAVFYPGRVMPAHTEYEHYYRDNEDGLVYPSVTTKTSLLSRSYYKQMAANKAVDHIQTFLINNHDYDVDRLTEVFEEARYRHQVSLEQAGNWGTEAHDCVDRYLIYWLEHKKKPKTMREFVNEDMSGEGTCGALSAELFFNDYTLFPIASEKKVISKKHRYGGTLDSLWLVGECMKGKEGRADCTHVWADKGKDKIKCMVCNRIEKLVLCIIDWKTSNQIFGHGSMGKYEYAMQVGGYDTALREMTGIKPKKHYIVRLDKQQPKYEIGVITDIKHASKMFVKMSEISDFARSKNPPIVPLIKKERIII